MAGIDIFRVDVYNTEDPVPRSEKRRFEGTKNIGVGIGGLGLGYAGWKAGQAAREWRQATPVMSKAAEDWGKSSPAAIGRSIKSKGKGILESAMLKIHKAMHFRRMLNLQSKLSEIRFELVDNPLYPKGKKSSVRKVPISKIVSTQEAVSDKRVETYKKKPGRKLPELHKVKGKYYVEDGNHRIVSKMEKGETTIRARVMELRARLREIHFATFDYTRKLLAGNPVFAQKGETGYDPRVERQTRSVFLRKNPLSEQEQAKRARERGAPVISTTEHEGELIGSHRGTENKKKIWKKGQQTKPYRGIKADIRAQQKGLTALPKEIPQEELPLGENLPKQKGGEVPVRGSGVPGTTKPPHTWDPSAAGPGDIHYTYPGQLPPHLRPSPTSEEIRSNALKWRDVKAYTEAKTKGGVAVGSPETERAEVQRIRDRLALKIRNIRRETIQPMRAARRKALGLPAARPMTPGAMQRLREKAFLKPDEPIPETGPPGPFAHQKPSFQIGDLSFRPEQIQEINRGQQAVIADHQAKHLVKAESIKQGIIDRVHKRLGVGEEREGRHLMGDAKRAVITRYSELKKSAKAMVDQTFDPNRTGATGDLARKPPPGLHKVVSKPELENWEVSQLATHAGVDTDWIKKQHEAFVHHTRLGTQQASEEIIRKSLGKRIFGGVGMPPEPPPAATYPAMKLLGKRLAIGGGIAAGLGLGGYAAYKLRKRKKEFSSRLKEIRFDAKGMIPYSRAKKLVAEVKRRTLLRAGRQGLLKKVGPPTPESLVEQKLDDLNRHIKAYQKGQVLINSLHRDMIRDIDTVGSARYKIGKRQYDLAKGAGYLEGTSEMEKVLEAHKAAASQKIGSLKEKVVKANRNVIRTGIGVGAAGLGVGAGLGYATGVTSPKRDHREKRFSVPGGGALKRLRGKLKGHLGQELAIGTALTGGITAADATTSAIYPGGQTRKQAAWEGAKRGAIYGSVLSGVEPLIRIPLSKRLAMASNLENEIRFYDWKKSIRFEDPGDIPSPWNRKKRLTVAQDRYRKVIREHEIQRKEANLGKSALAGAALGGVLRHNLKGVAIGAAGGLAAQTAAMIYGRGTKDPYGEESIASKRIERLPYQVGGLAAGGLLAHKLYKGATKLSSRSKLINFQGPDLPTRDPGTPWHIKEAQRWLKHPQSRVQNAQKWLARGGRIRRDLAMPRTKTGKIIDERGRERTPEWKKDWFQRSIYGGAAIGGIVGVGLLGHRIKRAATAGAKVMAEHKVGIEELSPGKQMALNITSGNIFRAAKSKIESKIPAVAKGTRKVGALHQEFKNAYNALLKRGNKAVEGEVGQITGAVPRLNEKQEVTGYDLINPAKYPETMAKLRAAQEKHRKILEVNIPNAMKKAEKTQETRSVLDELTKKKEGELSSILDNLIQFQQDEPGYVKVKPHYRKPRRGVPQEQRKEVLKQNTYKRDAAIIGGGLGLGGIGTGLGFVLGERSRARAAGKIVEDAEKEWARIQAARKATEHSATNIFPMKIHNVSALLDDLIEFKENDDRNESRIGNFFRGGFKGTAYGALGLGAYGGIKSAIPSAKAATHRANQAYFVGVRGGAEQFLGPGGWRKATKDIEDFPARKYIAGALKAGRKLQGSRLLRSGVGALGAGVTGAVAGGAIGSAYGLLRKPKRSQQ